MTKTCFFLSATSFLLILVFTSTFHSPASAGDYVIRAIVDDFEPGEKIHVCIREVKPGNPFEAEGYFNCGAIITAVDAPFPGGGVTGDQLMHAVQEAFGSRPVGEVRVRALTAGRPVDDPNASMMTVAPGHNEFYNSYVGRDQNGRSAIFLDVDVTGE